MMMKMMIMMMIMVIIFDAYEDYNDQKPDNYHDYIRDEWLLSGIAQINGDNDG